MFSVWTADVLLVVLKTVFTFVLVAMVATKRTSTARRIRGEEKDSLPSSHSLSSALQGLLLAFRVCFAGGEMGGDGLDGGCCGCGNLGGPWRLWFAEVRLRSCVVAGALAAAPGCIGSIACC